MNDQTHPNRLKHFLIGAGFAVFLAMASVTALKISRADEMTSISAVTAASGTLSVNPSALKAQALADARHSTSSLALFSSAHADDAPMPSASPTPQAAAVLEPPAWLTGVVQSVLGMFPQIGPIVVTVTKWLGFLAVILTIVSGAVTTLTTAGAGLFNVVGLTKVADVLKKINDYAQPWLKWFSMFNVQKK